jgi:folate-binding protein YgfZ
MTPGLSALLRGVAIVDLSDRGRIRVTGEDRARLLHAMSTNHIEQMKPGDGLYAFFLNAQGRILADAYVLCFEDHFLLDTEAETRQTLFEHLDKFIIADDVTLEDIGAETFCLGLEGPGASELACGAALPAPGRRYAHIDWGAVSVADIAMTGEQGVRFYGPLARRDEIVQINEGCGAIAASPGDAEAARIHNFRPRYGHDLTDATLPQETQQTQALHFQKGCYLGQEIVERIRSRGHVNKTLMGFTLEAEMAPAPGSALIAGGKEVGEVTSAVQSPEGKVFGLAMVRVPYNKPGEVVGVNGRPAQLMPPALS